MKVFIFIFFAFAFLSCTSLQNMQASRTVQTNRPSSNGSPRFIDDISVSANAVAPTKKNAKQSSEEVLKAYLPEKKQFNTPQIIINSDQGLDVKVKFAALLQVDLNKVESIELLSEVNNWMGTPYRYGGNSKSGIDCSAFVQQVFEMVYNKKLPRTAREQYKEAEKLSLTDLQSGDLVFFNTTGGVSHVGIYLQNNKFAHASTSSGVTISSLLDAYYMQRLVGAKRVE